MSRECSLGRAARHEVPRRLHAPRRRAEVGAHEDGDVVDDLVRPRVRAAREGTARAIVRLAVDAPIARAEALGVHARVRAHVVQLLVHARQWRLRLARLLHLHLDEVPVRRQVIDNQKAQAVGGRIVGVLSLRDGGQRVEKVRKVETALELGLRLREDEVDLRAVHVIVEEAGALLDKLHEHERVHRVLVRHRRRAPKVCIEIENLLYLILRQCGLAAQCRGVVVSAP